MLLCVCVCVSVLWFHEILESGQFMSDSLLAEFGSPASGHAGQPETFDTPLGVFAASLPSGPGHCVTPVTMAPLTRAAAAAGGDVPLADTVTDLVAAEEAIGQEDTAVDAGVQFDPLTVPHLLSNPVQRPFNAPSTCGPFNLATDARFSAISASGVSTAHVVEAELLSWQLSYLFDLFGFCKSACAEFDGQAAAALATVGDHLRAVFDRGDERLSELYVRCTKPNNTRLLEAIDRRRRGTAPGIQLAPAVASVLQQVEQLELSAAISEAGRTAGRGRGRQQQGRAPGRGRGREGGRGGFPAYQGRGGGCRRQLQPNQQQQDAPQ